MALFKNMALMEAALKVPSPYSGHSGPVTNLGEITVHGSRRVEVLKLWLSLQHIGRLGYRQLVDEGCALADYFLRKVAERPFLQTVGKPDMNILCFRGTPDWIASSQWDDWNFRLQDFLLSDGEVFFSLPPYREARWLRTVLLSPYSDAQLVDRVFDNLDSFAEQTRLGG